MKIVDTDGVTQITSEVLDKWDRDYKNSWRWKLVDKFFPKGFDNYNISYFVTRPWEFPKSCYRHIKWAWERVFQGWDERVVWSIDYHLDIMIPLWVRKLKTDNIGFPITMYNEEDYIDENYNTSEESTAKASKKWDDILDKIAEGFEAHKRMEDESVWINHPEYETLNKKFEEGFDLFKKYYGNLWD